MARVWIIWSVTQVLLYASLDRIGDREWQLNYTYNLLSLVTQRRTSRWPQGVRTR